MTRQKNVEWAYMRFPEWAWEVLSETLALDMESSSVYLDLRAEIEDAFRRVEHLVLVSQEEVTLRPGDRFEIIPTAGGVVIRSQS